jgi:hypothetical protein
MLSKIIRFSAISLFSLLLCFITYRLCYFVAEKYFFDKFFYQKNTTYGYWSQDKEVILSDFGYRSKDLLTYFNSSSDKVLGDTDNNSYRIAIIGDSLVWGTGIKNNERFAYILEQKLNHIHPTTIFSLANPGDDFFDNYVKYLDSSKFFGKIDLYIFGLFNNDLAFSNSFIESQKKLKKNLAIGCPGKIYTEPTFDLNNEHLNQDYTIAGMGSLNPSSANYCAFQKLISLLPQQKTIYIDLGSLINNDELQQKFWGIVSSHLPVINIPYQDTHKTAVSQFEKHPNSYSNLIYADILFNEITTNPRWNFIKK